MSISPQPPKGEPTDKVHTGTRGTKRPRIEKEDHTDDEDAMDIEDQRTPEAAPKTPVNHIVKIGGDGSTAYGGENSRRGVTKGNGGGRKQREAQAATAHLLNQGSYGCIYRPALPIPEFQETPDQPHLQGLVTKIMLRKNAEYELFVGDTLRERFAETNFRAWAIWFAPLDAIHDLDEEWLSAAAVAAKRKKNGKQSGDASSDLFESCALLAKAVGPPSKDAAAAADGAAADGAAVGGGESAASSATTQESNKEGGDGGDGGDGGEGGKGKGEDELVQARLRYIGKRNLQETLVETIAYATKTNHVAFSKTKIAEAVLLDTFDMLKLSLYKLNADAAILHMDIKAANILCPDKCIAPVLIDFGMSIDMKTNGGPSHWEWNDELLKFFSFSYTPGYDAWCPEISLVIFLVSEKAIRFLQKTDTTPLQNKKNGAFPVTEAILQEVIHNMHHNNHPMFEAARAFSDGHFHAEKYKRTILAAWKNKGWGDGKPAIEVVREIIESTWMTWDAFALSIVYSRAITAINKNLNHVDDNQTYSYLDKSELLRLIHPDPFSRGLSSSSKHPFDYLAGGSQHPTPTPPPAVRPILPFPIPETHVATGSAQI